MGFEYRVKDQGGLYFVTFTVHQWVDVFTRKLYVDLLLDSIKYCQCEKGLKVYAWIIMSNHCHLIISAAEENLSDIIRDLKKFTSKSIYKAIQENTRESRREWLIKVLSYNGKVWFWEEGYHGEEILSESFSDSKVDYLHLNPVRSGIIEKAEDYLWSSAGDFYGVRKGFLVLSEL